MSNISYEENKENRFSPRATGKHDVSNMHDNDESKSMFECVKETSTSKADTNNSQDTDSKTVPSCKDFVIIKPISRGAFGKVFLGYKKDNPAKKYAIKVMKKADMIHKNLVHQVIAERNALALSKSPFVVRLFYSFQSELHIYLVMEYMIGGDLKSLLAIYGYFDEEMAVFYTAEIALALEYLHSHGIVHRDLKPDNMLISASGHIKLTDFGLSQVDLSRQISIKDLENTPGISKEKLNNDNFRTPGQILSLTSNFNFIIPQSKSRCIRRQSGDSLHCNPALSSNESCGSLRNYMPPPVMNLAQEMEKSLSKYSGCKTSALVTPSSMQSPSVCMSQRHGSTDDSSMFLTNSTPTSCSFISKGLQKSYAAQNLKSLRESCVNKSNECGNKKNNSSAAGMRIMQSRECDNLFNSSTNRHSFSSDLNNSHRCRRRKRTFLCVDKSPYTPKVGTGLTSEFSMVALGDEHRLKRHNSSIDGNSTTATESSVSSQKLNFSCMDVNKPIKTVVGDHLDSSSLSELEDSVFGLPAVDHTSPNSSCFGDNQSDTNQGPKSKGGHLELSRPDRGTNLELGHSLNASQHSIGSSPELSERSKANSFELSHSLSWSQKTSLGSSVHSVSTDDQMSIDGVESVIPSVLSTVFEDGRQSVGNDADVSNMSTSTDGNSFCNTGRSSFGLISTRHMNIHRAGQHSMEIVSTESSADAQLTTDIKCKGKDATQTVHPFKVMRFSSLPTYISTTDTECSDACNTPIRSYDCQSFETPVMKKGCTPLRTPKSVRRGAPDKDRILGTPDYLAPELLLQTEHDSAVDWWALGVCLYEFLTGLPPFNDATPEAVFQHILNRDLVWPEGHETLSPEAQYAIERLLDMDPKTRATVEELRTMPLMEDLNWDNLLTTTPQFVPNPDNDTDTTYFQARNTLHKLTVSAVDLDA